MVHRSSVRSVPLTTPAPIVPARRSMYGQATHRWCRCWTWQSAWALDSRSPAYPLSCRPACNYCSATGRHTRSSATPPPHRRPQAASAHEPCIHRHLTYPSRHATHLCVPQWPLRDGQDLGVAGEGQGVAELAARPNGPFQHLRPDSTPSATRHDTVSPTIARPHGVTAGICAPAPPPIAGWSTRTRRQSPRHTDPRRCGWPRRASSRWQTAPVSCATTHTKSL